MIEEVKNEIEEIKKEVDKELMEALKKIREELPYIEWDILEDFENNYLTVNTGRSGKKYLWYKDNSYEVCICLDTLEQIDNNTIEKEFC